MVVPSPEVAPRRSAGGGPPQRMKPLGLAPGVRRRGHMPSPTTARRGPSYDAVVVGSGPNGLAAAIALARTGRRVLVRETAATVGGGMRSHELTLPGFVHDVCSAVHPLGISSPFFRALPLADHGLRWIQSPVALAHPMDDAPTVLLHRTLERTAAELGQGDDRRYAQLMAPYVEHWAGFVPDLLAPLHWPRHPWLLGTFGLRALRSATSLLRSHFRDHRTRAMLAGICAHATIPLDSAASFSFGFVLALAAHTVGWPIPEGGSQSLANALASYLRSLGGEIETEAPVHSLDDLPPAPLLFLDVTPRQALRIVGDRFPSSYRDRLANFRYGPGSFKVDWALSEPVPWRDPACAQAATVHLGGTMEQMAESEAAVWRGQVVDRPYALIVQPSLFDRTRAPAGRHTLWGYCHVPNGCDIDVTPRIEAQVERFAPGFRDVIIARRITPPSGLEAYNANYVGGDISGGANLLGQLFFRPVRRWSPYHTPVPGLFFCSSSTPPGGGVHGMSGWHAVRAALGDEAGQLD